MALLLISTQIAAARPQLQNPFLQDDKTLKKLPPIQYVRSRNYDMQYVVLDLRFDWEKE